MIKKILLAAASLTVVLVALAFIMYLRNTTPVVQPISTAEAANPSKPYVVKLHAQWCPVCMLTMPVWSQIVATYSTRVNLVVFDFTNQATTDTSRAEAKRLGLEQFFEDAGSTGTIAILDGRSKDVVTVIHGSRDFDAYRSAIDANLRAVAK
jgi:thiol-disulfide isomerase/thioredoxin